MATSLSAISFSLVRHKHRRSTRTSETAFSDVMNVVNKKLKVKVGRIFVVMLFELIFCFLPAIVLLNELKNCPEYSSETKRIMMDFVQLSVSLFSALNPFIYCWRLKSYRTALLVVLGLREKHYDRPPSSVRSCSNNSSRNNSVNDQWSFNSSFNSIMSTAMTTGNNPQGDESKLMVPVDRPHLSARMKRRAYYKASKGDADELVETIDITIWTSSVQSNENDDEISSPPKTDASKTDASKNDAISIPNPNENDIREETDVEVTKQVSAKIKRKQFFSSKSTAVYEDDSVQIDGLEKSNHNSFDDVDKCSENTEHVDKKEIFDNANKTDDFENADDVDSLGVLGAIEILDTGGTVDTNNPDEVGTNVIRYAPAVCHDATEIDNCEEEAYPAEQHASINNFYIVVDNYDDVDIYDEK